MEELPGGTRGKEFTCNAGDLRDKGLISGWGRSLEEGMATHSSVLAWRIPRTGSLMGCHLWGHTESDTTEAT